MAWYVWFNFNLLCFDINSIWTREISRELIDFEETPNGISLSKPVLLKYLRLSRVCEEFTKILLINKKHKTAIAYKKLETVCYVSINLCSNHIYLTYVCNIVCHKGFNFLSSQKQIVETLCISSHMYRFWKLFARVD